MNVQSFSFCIFIAVLLLVHWKLPQKFRWIVLLLGSYYFIYIWNPFFLAIIVGTTLVNYLFSLLIYWTKYRKIVLALAIFLNVGLLFLFKYYNFFILSVEYTQLPFLFQIKLPHLSILAPIGISFYTFQSLGYLVDMYRKKYEPEIHFGYFSLFVAFFGQLTAGPISRGNELLIQLKHNRFFHDSTFTQGLQLFTLGMFKKMVIADNLATVVNYFFSNQHQMKGLTVVIALILYSWQIYMDFSGYTDMTRGVSRLFGIELPKNFIAPYLSTSLTEFWRKWHMSLSQWFRDYLYIPLGGNRKNLFRTCINTLIVFTLCGLWHGASGNFVLWGIFHGLILSIERIAKTFVRVPIRIPVWIKNFYTYIVICISWIFFRSPTIADSFMLLKNLFTGLKNFVMPSYIYASIQQLFQYNSVEIIITTMLLLSAIVIEHIFSSQNIVSKLQKLSTPIKFCLYVIAVFCILELRNANIKEFIYTRF